MRPTVTSAPPSPELFNGPLFAAGTELFPAPDAGLAALTGAVTRDTSGAAEEPESAFAPTAIRQVLTDDPSLSFSSSTFDAPRARAQADLLSGELLPATAHFDTRASGALHFSDATIPLTSAAALPMAPTAGHLANPSDVLATSTYHAIQADEVYLRRPIVLPTVHPGHPHPAPADDSGNTLSQAAITSLSDGIRATLSPIDDALGARVFAENLPLLGTGLKDAFDSSGVGGALHDVANIRDAILAGLGTLTGADTYTAAQVTSALDTALRANGFVNPGIAISINEAGDPLLSFATDRTFAAVSTPLSTDLSLPGIGFQSGGSADTVVKGTFNFSAGLDANGFYLDTKPADTQLSVGLDTKLNGALAEAHLGPLRFTATDLASNPTDFNAAFGIQFKDPDGDGKLRVAEVGGAGDLLTAKLTGEAGVRLHLASALGTTAALPTIGADLNFDWVFDKSAVNPGPDESGFGNKPTVAFNHVSIGLGSFFSKLVGPVLSKVGDLTAPIQPIIHVLTQPIGFLHELGLDYSLLDIAKAGGQIDQATLDRIKLADTLLTFISTARDGGGAIIDLGDYSLGTQDVRGAGFQLAEAKPQPVRDALSAGEQDPEAADFLSDEDGLAGGGLHFPILENPETAINLLFGKQVDFFTYHVPNLDIGPAGFDEFFPIFGPFGVELKATVEAHAYLDIGYDSTGLVQFATTGDAEDIFNGFYVVDQRRADGTDAPEATLTGKLEAFAAANAGFAELGVGGGIVGTLNAFINDTDATPGDGLIHVAQLTDACDLISLSGDITAGLSAYLTVDLGLFDITYEKDLGHEVLLSFASQGCDAAGQPGVPKLAHLSGASVTLHVGAATDLRGVGSPDDNSDDFAVVHVSGDPGDETVGVIGHGLFTEDGDAVGTQNYTVGADGRIVAKGGVKDDVLALAPDVSSPGELHGGDGADRLVGGGGNDSLNGDVGVDLLVGGAGNDSLDGGTDQDYLDGGDGNDTLLGGSESDILVGSAGADVLNGNSGFDTASYVSSPVGTRLDLTNPDASTGDALGDTFSSIERYVGSNFNDTLRGAASSDNLDGATGDDSLNGRGGDDLLVGGTGADTLSGGDGNDFAAYAISTAGVNVSLFTGDGHGGDAEGDVLIGVENLQGSNFADTLEGDDGPNWLRGLDGLDVMRGLGGNDLLEGGKDNDSLDGGAGIDTLRASLDPASLDPKISGGHDTLRGGAGNDELHGDAGGDLLDGGDDADQIYGGKDNDTILGGAGDDLVYGGVGDDSIDAGEGSNAVHGDDGNDTIASGAGPDQLDGGLGNDSLSAGAGLNVVNGNGGNDVLVALGGNDTLDGADGNDRLDAGDGANVLTGDAGNDFLVSGTGIDSLHGGTGNDTATSGAGDDRVFGDEDNDMLDGGIGSDSVDGGTGDDLLFVGALRSAMQDPDRLDHLFGGAGVDTITADFSNQSTPMVVVAGQTQSLVFSDGAEARDFENVHDLFTGSGNDSLRLDAAADDSFDNLLKTGAGNDTIYSGAGNDNVDAGGNDDFVNGGGNNAVLTFDPDLGTVSGFTTSGDTLAGGTGNDTLSFEGFYKILPSGAPLGVTINLGTNETGGAASGTTISGFENVNGTSYDDELTGDDGPNIINGNVGNDVLVALGGNDTLDGADGNDHLDAGDGANVLTGDAGNDVLVALGGNDTLDGADGNDRLDAGDGANVLTGDAGNDFLVSGTGIDIVSGGTGNDTAIASAGNDSVSGDEDNDMLDGGIGYDSVDGGTGDDLLSVGALRSAMQDPDRLDHLFGGAGVDTITADFSNQSTPMVVVAGQTQSLVFSDGAEARDFENVHDFFTGSGNDSLRLDGAADDAFDNLLKTGAGNDTIYSGAGSDNVDAGGNDDFVNGGGNNAVLTFDGTFGNVTGFSAPGDTLTGGAGNDTLSFEGFGRTFPSSATTFGITINLATNQTGGAAAGITISGFENIIGTNFGDELTGDAGPNLILPLRGGGNTYNSNGSTSTGPDRIDGGAGNDTLQIDFSLGDAANSPGIYTAGAGFFRPSTDPQYSASYDYANIESLQITGAGGNDGLYATFLNGSDTLKGLAGNDTLGGYGGSDILSGGNGNDIITGQGQAGSSYGDTAGGSDFFDGGAGNDLIEDIAFTSSLTPLGSDARFQLDGSTGIDTLSADFSNEGAPIVWSDTAPANVDFADGAYFHNFEQLRDFASGSGNDSLTQTGRVDNLFYLGAGNDTVQPGIGFDSVNGGTGNDLLILDYTVGDSPTALGVSISADGDGNGLSRRQNPVGGGNLDYLEFRGFERLQVTGSSHDDTLTGIGTGDDTISGGGGNDTIDGKGGSNLLDGGDGNDSLVGSASRSGGGEDDTITGGSGNDILRGMGGNDSLSGGADNDQLYGTDDNGDALPTGSDVLDGGSGNDLIVEFYSFGSTFTDATTHFQLDGGAGIDTLTADFGNQTQAIAFVGDGRANSVDFADGSYLRNFEILGNFVSGPGNDALTQFGRFDNNINTRAGSDTINPGLGIDQVNGGDGNDLLILDYSQGDTANVGGVVGGGNSFQRRDANTGALIDSIYIDDIERLQITGGSKADSLAGQDSRSDTLSGGAGNDTLDGRSGADLMDGGAGNDLFFVDNTGDAVTEEAGNGTDTILASMSYTLGTNVENLTLSAGNSGSVTGNNTDNVLIGSDYSNVVNGVKGNDTLLGDGSARRGVGQQDSLTGGQGADLFILGNTAGRLYDDGTANSNGTADYALISDFTPDGQTDRLQLNGNATQYFLGASPVNGVAGTGLFFDSDGNGAFDPNKDELLAVLRSTGSLTAANTINNAFFVTGG